MSGLRRSALQAFVWGAGATAVRDVLQFATMLLLVRLIAPEDYGTFALAQAIIGFVAVASYKSAGNFALQARDPDAFDWDTHFAVGLVLNPLAIALALAIAVGLALAAGSELARVAPVLALMALTFLVDVPATYRGTVLQARHSWARLRLLVLAGAALSSIGMIALALAGAGVYALASGNLFFAIPFLVDFFRAPERPRLSRARLKSYRAGFAFWLNRGVADALIAGSALAERAILARQFGLASLGIYSRAVGLAQTTSGRVAPLTMQMLYPILTRADSGSARFRRFSGLLLEGMALVAIPAAAFLMLEADAVVRVLYGEGWLAVIPLLPLAVAWLALKSLGESMNAIVVANLNPGPALALSAGVSAVQLVVILLAAPFGAQTLLTALLAHAAVALMAQLALAARRGAVSIGRCATGIGVAMAASLVGALALAVLPTLGPALGGASLLTTTLDLLAAAAVFGIVVAGVVILVARTLLRELFEVMPLPRPLAARLRRL